MVKGREAGLLWSGSCSVHGGCDQYGSRQDYSSIRSFATTTRPSKCRRAALIHISSVTAGSSAGMRCESTNIPCVRLRGDLTRLLRGRMVRKDAPSQIRRVGYARDEPV